MSRLLGAVLAGGQARRFGSDKALAILHGSSLIERVVASLAAQTETVVICGRRYGDYPMLEDIPTPSLGPLGGLAAALAFARSAGFDIVVSAPCDVPFLPRDLVEKLGTSPAGGYIEDCPLVGAWPASLAPELDGYLRSDASRSVRRWAEQAGVASVRLDHPFPNVNTAQDLAALAALTPR